MVEQQRQTRARVQPLVVAAFGTNLLIVLQGFPPHDLAAVRTFEPQPFGADALVAFLGFERRFVASEPSHPVFSIRARGRLTSARYFG